MKNNSNQLIESTDFKIIGRCLVIYLSKDFDHHYVTALREKSDRLIEKKNIKNIIFDFSKVNFMDSSGIGMIMGRYKKVIFIGGKVGVTNISPSIDRIFRISGLYKIIEKYDTNQDAIEAF